MSTKYNSNKMYPKVFDGYQKFKKIYSENKQFSGNIHEQNPEVMVVSCSDSRVDPAILFQCDPGEIFVIRNMANIIPPYENDNGHHGTSAGLEYGVCFLQVKHLIILGHSSCGGVKARVSNNMKHTDFINDWVNQINICDSIPNTDVDSHSKKSIIHSFNNCMTFPWINERVKSGQLYLHPWYLDISDTQLYQYNKNIDDFDKIEV